MYQLCEALGVGSNSEYDPEMGAMHDADDGHGVGDDVAADLGAMARR
jgi:hypothetical protein